MPFIPWDIRDPATGLFPEALPYAEPINGLLTAGCPIYGALENWQRFVYGLTPPGVLGAIPRLLIDRNFLAVMCEPLGGLGGLSPASASAPVMDENCATQGNTAWKTNVSNNPEAPTWIDGSFFWDCTSNIGIPVGQPVWSFITGNTWGYLLTVQRADGTGTTQITCGETAFGDDRSRVSIQAINFAYCPGCNLPDPPVPPPTIPPQGTTPTRPVINLPITLPQPIGLPPITVNIPYSPVVNLELDASLQPSLTLAPNIELAPEFEFAPTFEFNFGGVSIGGGGYAEPREDAAELADCDCPDPCPPPGDQVDYQRVQDAMANVIASRWRLPGYERDPSLGAFGSFAPAVAISLDADTIAVQVQFDLTNYVGGGTPTVNGVEGIGYYGWYTFIGALGLTTGAERHYISSSSTFIEVPPYSGRFTVYGINSVQVRVRQVRLGEIPPA